MLADNITSNRRIATGVVLGAGAFTASIFLAMSLPVFVLMIAAIIMLGSGVAIRSSNMNFSVLEEEQIKWQRKLEIQQLKELENWRDERSAN